MTNINLIHVSAPKDHPQRILQIKATQAQRVHLCMHRTHWNDYSIKILKQSYIKSKSIKLHCCDTKTT
jgi:hypothetical protein